MVVQRTMVTVKVTETVIEDDEVDRVEIICPVVIHPGEFFTCVADIPTGYDIKAIISMTDDENPGTEADTSPEMHIPSEQHKKDPAIVIC